MPAGDLLIKVRRRLGSGRGNVWDDILETNGASYADTRAAVALQSNRGFRSVLEEIEKGAEIPDALWRFMKPLVPFLLMGAGNCMEHALVAMFEAIGACPGARIRLWKLSGKQDHQFLLVNGIVIDAWEESQNGVPFEESEWRRRGAEACGPEFIGDGRNWLGGVDNVARDLFPSESIEVAREEGRRQLRGQQLTTKDDFQVGAEFKIY